jgi:hypothetical protein
MKNSLNVLHYSIYLMHYKIHLFANKLNPFMLIHKIPTIKRRNEKFGIDAENEVNKAFENKEYGLSVMVSGGGIIGIIFLIFMSISNLLLKFLMPELSINNYFWYSLAVIAYIVCYFLIFRKDIYLKYFEEYENWENNKVKKKLWMSFSFIIGVISLFFASLLCCN